jgi:hypothetical protein
MTQSAAFPIIKNYVDKPYFDSIFEKLTENIDNGDKNYVKI